MLWRRETVRIQTRSGRDVTQPWLDIATAAMELPPDTVLDGELVIWRDGKSDFDAVRSRASARGRRLAYLAHRYPASCAAWDCLMTDGQDLRARSYLERSAALLEVLEPLGPPLQAVPATDDVDVTRVWSEVLPEQGVDGIVAKCATGLYRWAGRGGRCGTVRGSTPTSSAAPAPPRAPSTWLCGFLMAVPRSPRPCPGRWPRRS
ncbi:ATP-dependent DNA ligase [Streptomyces sp. NPDC050264]|uniref:ATP-dependent DNA ligase n=1 Tax=Streptomyces sp. NPDC050264 TaxID=3155038 RepID=UPI0034207E25